MLGKLLNAFYSFFLSLSREGLKLDCDVSYISEELKTLRHFLESKEQQIELDFLIKMCTAVKISIFLFSLDVLYEH